MSGNGTTFVTATDGHSAPHMQCAIRQVTATTGKSLRDLLIVPSSISKNRHKNSAIAKETAELLERHLSTQMMLLINVTVSAAQAGE
jgi:hypothetical protein